MRVWVVPQKPVDHRSRRRERARPSDRGYIRDPLLVLDQNLRVVAANRAFYQTFRMNRPDIRGRPIYGLGDGQWDIPELRLFLEDVGPSTP